MRKFIIVFLIAIYAAGMSFDVFAGSPSSTDLSADRFEITGGIDKETEVTFEETKTITGTADKGTVVTITVYTPDGDEMIEQSCYEIVVNSTGYFSQIVELSIGENYITVEAVKDGKVYSAETTVKRKNSTIKSDLEQSIAVPGQSVR